MVVMVLCAVCEHYRGLEDNSKIICDPSLYAGHA